jgi:type IX secretion system PorP/SprF family membrane protein
MKKILFISFILLSGFWASAQQLPIFSQYLYNKYLINPAVAGSDGYTSFNLTAREQWVGYYGAPQTFAFSGQTRLLKRPYTIKSKSGFRRQNFKPGSDGRIGIGASVFSDKNGITRKNGFQASYSYHIWLQNTTQLSMGLAVTGYHFKIDENEINFEDPNDPWLNSDLRKGIFVPDAAVGICLLNPKFSAGLSIDQLFQAALKIGDDAYENFRMSRHINIFGSYNIETSRYTELQPSFLFRMSEQIKPQADIGLTYIFKQTFWAGLTYRTSGAMIAIFGTRYENLWFGYSFDFTLQEIQRITYGTHELTVALRFGDGSRRYRWLDRY